MKALALKWNAAAVKTGGDLFDRPAVLQASGLISYSVSEEDFLSLPQENNEESQNSADETAQSEQAQGTMYEGALAGLTEEEIAAMAMAEESSVARTDTDSGVEGAVD